MRNGKRFVAFLFCLRQVKVAVGCVLFQVDVVPVFFSPSVESFRPKECRRDFGELGSDFGNGVQTSFCPLSSRSR